MEEGYKRTREKNKDINIVKEMMVFLTGETKDLNLVIKLIHKMLTNFMYVSVANECNERQYTHCISDLRAWTGDG